MRGEDADVEEENRGFGKSGGSAKEDRSEKVVLPRLRGFLEKRWGLTNKQEMRGKLVERDIVEMLSHSKVEHCRQLVAVRVFSNSRGADY